MITLPWAVPASANGAATGELAERPLERGSSDVVEDRVMATRMHGVISLEIEGVYAQQGLNPKAIYAHEIASILRAAGL